MPRARSLRSRSSASTFGAGGRQVRVELETVRLTDDRLVNNHYDLIRVTDLDVLLEELVALLVDDCVPEGAVVAYAPGARLWCTGACHEP
jgi:hypothetical protein